MEESIAQKFHDAYINADEKGLEKLWEESTPNTLIKFYPAKYESDGVNYLIESLRNNTLWLSSPMFFNDPFDCVINVDYQLEAEQISKQILAKYFDEDIIACLLNSPNGKNAVANVAEYLKGENIGRHIYLEKSIYVSCFSESHNLDSLRMWAHYAGNHSGVCVEYDFSTVHNISRFGCIPIQYTNNYNYLLDTSNISEDVANYMKFFTKAKEWEHEREWRVAVKSEHLNMKGFNASIASPVAIYLGCKVSDKLKEDLIAICKDKNVAIYQMKLRQGCMELYPELLKD